MYKKSKYNRQTIRQKQRINMNITKETIDILGTFSGISDTIIISHPCTAILTSRNLQAYVTWHKQEAFETIAVRSITSLKAVTTLVSDYTMTNNSGVLTLKNCTTSVDFVTTSLKFLESQHTGQVNLLQRIKKAELLGSFELSNELMRELKKASSLLSTVTDITVDFGKGTIGLSSDVSSSGSFINSIEVQDTTDTTCTDNSMTCQVNLFNQIPTASYKVEVRQSGTGSLAMIFSTQIKKDDELIADVDIVLAAKA